MFYVLLFRTPILLLLFYNALLFYWLQFFSSHVTRMYYFSVLYAALPIPSISEQTSNHTNSPFLGTPGCAKGDKDVGDG